MQNDQSDLELIFKKRARRRLVGAIALVLLMVIVLPLLLKDRTKMMPQQEIAIVMPNTSSEETLNNTLSEVDGVAAYEEVIELPKPEPVPVAEPKQKAEPEKPVETNKPKEAPVKVTKVEPQPKATTQPVEQQKTVVKKEPEKTTDNQFYVQIGVFSDPDNVKKLEVKLNELGYRPVLEKITTDTGQKTRLRTANFIGKNEAMIALENIKDAGLTGMVVSQK